MNRHSEVFDHANAHVAVYQVLDEVLASTAVPPGAKGAMFSIIDHLRSSSSPVEDILRAERISVEIHKLESALRGSDVAAVDGARTSLKSLAVAWLDARVSTRARFTAVALDAQWRVSHSEPGGSSFALPHTDGAEAYAQRG